MTVTVERVAPARTRRNVELVLLVVAVGITLLAWINVDLGIRQDIPSHLLPAGLGFLALTGAFHLLLRWKAAYADPLLLPIATLLNGLGLVVIHRLDIAAGRPDLQSAAFRQLTWTAIAVVAAGAVLWFLRDHRVLRRYTYTALLVGIILLLMPLVPGLGSEKYGSKIWIQIGSMSFQPGEIAKIVLAIFFAGYLVQARDVLSLAGRKVLGFTFPRGRDLGPILLAWLISLAVLFFERDLGTSLLFFGLFVAMLYVATERVSWIAIGLTLMGIGTYLAYLRFAHFQRRVALWLDPLSEESLKQSDQVAKGLMGMAHGGLFGTGLGQGRPYLVPMADSDFIFASIGEELGLAGTFAILMLFVLFVERGLRTALGVRDGFGKLLALGLSFSVALQVFVVIGGLTRIIPLTGLTTPFMSAGGSSLLANWVITALLLRISDQARRPVVRSDGLHSAVPRRVRPQPEAVSAP